MSADERPISPCVVCGGYPEDHGPRGLVTHPYDPMSDEDPSPSTCPRCHADTLGPEHVSTGADRVDLVVRECSACGLVLVVRTAR